MPTVSTAPSGQITGLFSPFLEWYRNYKVSLCITTNGKSVLDIGCGRGAFLRALRSRGCQLEYTGLDTLAECIEANRRTFPEGRFIVWDIESTDSLPVSGPFDYITLIAFLEHLKSPSEILGKLSKVLSPKGLILVTTPRRGMEAFYQAGARIGLFSREANEQHTDLFFDENSLREVGKSADLVLLEYRRFLFGVNQLATFRKD